MSEDLQGDVFLRAVGGTMLAALRPDGRYANWSLAGMDRRLLPRLTAVASDHHVLPLVGRALADAGWDARAGLPRQIEASSLATTAQHLRASSDLAHLGSLLDATGAPWAAVKGPVLAHLAYPQPGLRTYGDLDVLVHPRAFGTVVTALEASGAVLLAQDWSYIERQALCEVSLGLRYGTCLDLHWHLVNNAHARSKFRWDTRASLARCRRVTIGGASIPTLDAEDTLLHVAVHAAISGGHRVSWAKDVERLVALGDCDWDEVVRRAKDARVTLPVGAMLQRSRRLLGADVPPLASRQLRVPRTSATVLMLGERLATPTRLAKGRHTGQLLMLSARADARSSVAAVADELHRRHGHGAPAEPGARTLTRGEEDCGDRQRYFEQIGSLGDMPMQS